MFGKALSTVFYITGAVTLAVGLMITAMITFSLPGYAIPLFIGGGLIVSGIVAQVKLRPLQVR
ncbi:MAG: hypothetical protein ACYC1U_01085 [Candidatus Aquicultorales bacterium]